MSDAVKVLFLDIDGVLNSTRTAVAFGGFPHSTKPADIVKFDHVAVSLIRTVCQETGARIVLSSTWRLDPDWQQFGRDLALPIFDRTGRSKDGKRGGEIATWLESYPADKYAIVDDDSDMLPEQMPFFVRTSHAEGLSWDNYEMLKHILGDKP